MGCGGSKGQQSSEKSAKKQNATDILNKGVAESKARHNDYDANGRTALFVAAMNGEKFRVKQILTIEGIDPDKGEESTGRTPAHAAAMGGHLACLEFLRDGRSDMRQPDKFNETPENLAELAGHKNIVEWLKAL